MLKFQHTIVYQTFQIILPSENSDMEIFINSHSGLQVILTKEPDKYCFHSDQGLAATYLMLTGGFKQDAESFKMRLEAKMEEIRNDRKKKYKTGPYLVFERQGTTNSDFSPHVKEEMEQFIISVDGFDSNPFREESQIQFSRLILALSLAAEPISSEKVSESFTIFSSDGKPIYPTTFSVGEMKLRISAPHESLESVSQWFHLVEEYPQLDRVYRLFTSSLELQDRLRSFLFAWSALEIFVHKVFNHYEQQLFQNLGKGSQSKMDNHYLKRIQKVMNGKYGTLDKFSIISATMNPENADADYKDFKDAKDIRDKLAHGQDFNESKLPISSIHRLLRKYIQLHVQK